MDELEIFYERLSHSGTALESQTTPDDYSTSKLKEIALSLDYLAHHPSKNLQVLVPIFEMLDVVELPMFLLEGLFRVLRSADSVSLLYDGLSLRLFSFCLKTVKKTADLTRKYRLLMNISRLLHHRPSILTSKDFADYALHLQALFINTGADNQVACFKLVRHKDFPIDPHQDYLGFLGQSLMAQVKLCLIHAIAFILRRLSTVHSQQEYSLSTVVLESITEAYGLDETEWVTLLHLIFVDDEDLYFVCLSDLIRLFTQYDLSPHLHPLIFYLDLVEGCNFEARRYFERWVRGNCQGLDFLYLLYRTYSLNMLSHRSEKMIAFHRDLAAFSESEADLDALVDQLEHFIGSDYR